MAADAPAAENSADSQARLTLASPTASTIRDVLVFGASTGHAQSPSNIRSRVLQKAVHRANVQLENAGVEPMPKLSPHSLRRTFASLLFAIDETPPYVMAQMGHTTASLTLAVYARQMNRRDGEPARLKALIQGAEVAAISCRASRRSPGLRP